MRHLRLYWWLYLAASAAMLTVVAGLLLVIVGAFSQAGADDPGAIRAAWSDLVAAAGYVSLVQGAALGVLWRLPPPRRERLGGEPTVVGSLALGVGLVVGAVVALWAATFLLGEMSLLLIILVGATWVFVVPVATVVSRGDAVFG